MKKIKIISKYEETDYPYRCYIISLYWNICLTLWFINRAIFYRSNEISFFPWGILTILSIIVILVSVRLQFEKKHYITTIKGGELK